MRTTRSLLALAALAVVAVGCKSEEPAPEKKTEAPKAAAAPAAPAKKPGEIDKLMLSAFSPLPAEVVDANNELTEDKISLGRMLYFDKRLSKNHDVSCNSCHALTEYGVDGKPFSPGHKGQLGGRNSPSVYNAAGHIAQFWDGREPNVEAQALGPIENPVEMANTKERALETLKSMPDYVAAFEKAFPGDKDAVSWTNVGKAIGAFERRLVTPSRWDKFLAGDEAALTVEEKEGFNAFVANGCVACHAGPNVGGQMFQKLGLVKPWPNQKDLGKYDVTKNEADKMFFKAMSLRNIAKTGPYFHDGSVATLEEAIKMMGTYQSGRDISDEDTKKIATFLGALTGELPTDYIKEPVLPASTKSTPKPDPT